MRVGNLPGSMGQVSFSVMARAHQHSPGPRAACHVIRGRHGVHQPVQDSYEAALRSRGSGDSVYRPTNLDALGSRGSLAARCRVGLRPERGLPNVPPRALTLRIIRSHSG